MTTLIEKIIAAQLKLRKLVRASTLDYSIEVNLLTTLISEVAAVGKKEQRETTDAEAIAVIKKFIKNNDDFLAANPGPEVSARLKRENDLLTTYLPEQLTETELTSIITNLRDTGATNTGLVMKALKEQFEGQYDGKLASMVAKAVLS